MQKTYTRLLFILCMALQAHSYGQQSIGIGTTTPDNNAALDIHSTTAGVLIPTLTTAQQTTLAGMLTTAEMGMMVTDATTGSLKCWTGSSWQALTPANALSAQTPLSVTTNNVQLNAGTQVGDLITWDGTNWVNLQPAIQHFSLTVDNRQPYLTLNYCIALQGIFPARSDAEPFVSEIELFTFNFAPTGWAFCNGQLLAISNNTALFSLVGTFYGGNGTSTFELPDLRGRTPMSFGQGPGLSNFNIGQTGGTESNTISQ
jgi:microcystin-dependent protein